MEREPDLHLQGLQHVHGVERVHPVVVEVPGIGVHAHAGQVLGFDPIELGLRRQHRRLGLDVVHMFPHCTADAFLDLAGEQPLRGLGPQQSEYAPFLGRELIRVRFTKTRHRLHPPLRSLRRRQSLEHRVREAARDQRRHRAGRQQPRHVGLHRGPVHAHAAHVHVPGHRVLVHLLAEIDADLACELGLVDVVLQAVALDVAEVREVPAVQPRAPCFDLSRQVLELHDVRARGSRATSCCRRTSRRSR